MHIHLLLYSFIIFELLNLIKYFKAETVDVNRNNVSISPDWFSSVLLFQSRKKRSAKSKVAQKKKQKMVQNQIIHPNKRPFNVRTA